MRTKLIIPIAVAAVAALASAAFAASQTTTGDIKSIDAAKHELVLANGDTFELGSKVKTKKLKVGEKVSVIYEVTNGKNVASKVSAAK